MERGIIVTGIGGFYDVHLHKDNSIKRCKLRGKIRLSHNKILVGDYVEISHIQCDEGIIESVLPRKTELVRPPIANINHVVVVISSQQPKPDLKLLDKILIQCERVDIKATICINKIDLDHKTANHVAEIYEKIGYTVLLCSVKTITSIRELENTLHKNITTFAGPSGAGKSSLINLIEPGLNLKVGDISNKLKRGKHTTRSVRLHQLNIGGYVADTPGFSRLDIQQIHPSDLMLYFREICQCSSKCRFRACLHYKEIDCAVKVEVENGIISRERYNNYLSFLQEIINNK